MDIDIKRYGSDQHDKKNPPSSTTVSKSYLYQYNSGM